MLDQLFFHFNEAPPRLTLDSESARDLLSMVQVLDKECTRSIRYAPLVHSLLVSILCYLARFRQSHPSSRLIEERVVALYHLIENHFRQEKKMAFYARKLSLSAKRVNELMRHHSGKTLTRLIHDRIILEAQRDLAFTRKSVKQIAHELEYDDVSYFCRFFRSMTGESPKAFRDKTFK